MDSFAEAVSHHQAGRLDRADVLYREVLRAAPGHADALHLLGVIAHQRGQHDAAINLIQAAIRLHPTAAPYHANVAEAFRAAGANDRAEAHCREALRLQPTYPEAETNLGLALVGQGKREEAVAHFEAAIGSKPHWWLPYFHLGNVHHALGRPYDASAVLREGLALCGANPALHGSIGHVLLELGTVDAALAPCPEAVRLQPDHPLGLTYLGDALRAAGRRDESTECYRRAVRLGPGLARAHHKLGAALAEQGNPGDAMALLTRAVELDPADADAGCALAVLLYEADRADEAIARFRQVLAAHPNSASAHNSLGFVLQDRGDAAGAAAEYAEAVRAKPQYADAHLNRGLLLTETGDKAEALAAFREALRQKPDHAEALAALALHLRDKLPAADLAHGEALLAANQLPPRSRAVLLYGLLQVWDARDETDQAAAAAAEANRIYAADASRRGHGYDPAEHRAYVDRIIAAYPREHFERVRGWSDAGDGLVFVLGLPRSGTSLTEQILASHPRVHGAGELVHVRTLYRSLPGLVGKNAPGVECVGDLTRDHVQVLAGRYLEAVRTLAPGAAVVVDKMPDNYLMLGLIATLFPKAKVVHTRRDVRDVGLSCWLTHFRHIQWSFDQGHIAGRIREYQRLAAHWKAVLPTPVLELDYEDLVSDLEPTARKLVGFCGLEWDARCLAFHETRRVVRTASMTQVREPLYRRAVNRWEKYREYLGPLLAGLAAEPRP